MGLPGDQPESREPPDTAVRILEDVRRELGITAWAVGAIAAVAALSTPAIVGSLLDLAGGIEPIGPEGAMNLGRLLVTTAPLTLALACIFGYFASGAGEQYGPVVAGIVIVATLAGFALVLGEADFNAPPAVADRPSGTLTVSACGRIYEAPDQGVSLTRAACEAARVAHPAGKVLAFSGSVLIDYFLMFGLAVFLSAFVLAYQLMRLILVHLPRLIELQRH